MSEAIESEIIWRARQTLRHVLRWTRTNVAEDSKGQDIGYRSIKAVKWSLMGALLMAREELIDASQVGLMQADRDTIRAAFDRLYEKLRHEMVIHFPDRVIFDDDLMITRFNNHPVTTFEEIQMILAMMQSKFVGHLMFFDHTTMQVKV